MNSLSWFLYAVDILASLVVFLTIAAGIAMVVIIIAIILLSDHNSNCRLYDEDSSTHKKSKIGIKDCRFWAKTGFTTMLIALVLVIAIPNTRTMYLILGSEVGEEVIESDTARRVHAAVNKKLDEYLLETD